MLTVVDAIDDEVVSRLFDVYEESMSDLASGFGGEPEMRTSYKAFLEEFISGSGQLLLVEREGGAWVSALRAIEFQKDHWFIEAVETAPRYRREGFARRLVTHAADHLRGRGAREITCTIWHGNVASQALHEACGFEATADDPMNPWGELEEGCILYRLTFC